MSTVSPIPPGYPTVCPNLVVEGASQLIAFLVRAFEANLRVCNTNADGSIAHAELAIGDSVVMVSDVGPGATPTVSSLHLYVENVDTVYAAAMAAGGTAEGPPEDRFWGDRTVNIFDPAGNRWWVSTHIEDLTEEEIATRAASM
jgi:PhnB protein